MKKLALTKVWKGLSFSMLFLLILITTPPLGLAVVWMLIGSSPPTLLALRRLKISTRKAIRLSAKEISSLVIKKFQQPHVQLRIAILLIVEIYSLYLLFSHLQIRETDDYLWYAFKQIAFTGLLIISILGLAWVAFSLGSVFESLFAKVVVSLAISACILFCRLLAIDFFSEHFPFPAAYLPVSFSIATIVLAFAFTSLIFAVLAFIFEMAMLLTFGKTGFKRHTFTKLIASVVFFTGFIGAYITTFALPQGVLAKGQLLFIKLSERYDFTKNHMCEAKPEESILFIDNVADRAIAATFPQHGKTPTRISDKELKDYMPKNFHMVRCNPMPLAEGRR